MQEIKPPQKSMFYYALTIILFMMIVNAFIMPSLKRASIEEVDYGTFMTMTENKQIEKVEFRSNDILFTDKDGKVYATGHMQDDGLVDRLYAAGAKFGSDIIPETSPMAAFLLSWVLPIAIFGGLGYLMSKRMMDRAGGGASSMMFGMGKSNAKVYVKSTEGIRFSDVAGEEEAKENLMEIVEYLHDPGKYKEIGATMPKGILLVGPPGTGKTMLAKAVAGESNVPFFSMSGSEFVEMFVGMGASKVRDLFRQAKEKAPCIVFIDEIDAIGKKRDGGVIGGNDEREQTLNQLLTEMDGFEENLGVVILAATNRPEALDPALTRPGRFDRRVPVELPDLQGRIDILKVHAKKIKIGTDVDFNKIARMAAGASGAELANIVNEAALRAVRDGRRFANQADMEESIEVVIAGYQKKNAILTDKEKLIVSYHEVGHALVAANDIEQATRLARAMITRYGMSDEFDMVAMETVTNQYLGGDTSLACSAETQALIDRKVVELVRAQHEKALKLLRDNKRKLDEIAEYLYFKETITGEEFMNILNRSPEPRRIGTQASPTPRRQMTGCRLKRKCRRKVTMI